MPHFIAKHLRRDGCPFAGLGCFPVRLLALDPNCRALFDTQTQRRRRKPHPIEEPAELDRVDSVHERLTWGRVLKVHQHNAAILPESKWMKPEAGVKHHVRTRARKLCQGIKGIRKILVEVCKKRRLGGAFDALPVEFPVRAIEKKKKEKQKQNFLELWNPSGKASQPFLRPQSIRKAKDDDNRHAVASNSANYMDMMKSEFTS